MSRFFFLLVCCWVILTSVHAQTLLTYGRHSVDAQDFLKAYKRNHPDTTQDKQASMRAYLDLYVNAKMKIREAYARRLDTLSHIRQEVENLRVQLVDKYMADPVLLERLKREAFQRSQTDREVAHLFIAFQTNVQAIDTARANRQKAAVEKQLQAGKSFFDLVQTYSDDPPAAKNQGKIGFITAFTLPYEMETAIYQTPVGKTSSWVRSTAGYHLFYVMQERSAVGTVRAKQILLALPPNADATEKNQIERLSDSLYQVLKKGSDLAALARLYSNDYVSAASGGALTPFGVGEYDPVFESNVLAIATNNDFAAPFQTAHGWHIVQRVSITKPSADLDAYETQQLLDQKVRADDRWRTAKDFIYELIRTQAGVRRGNYDEQAVWSYADSLLDRKPATAAAKTIQPNMVLLTIGKNNAQQTYSVSDWIQYVTNYRFQPDGNGPKPLVQMRDEWEQYAMTEYYKNNLTLFNAEYREQLTDFKEGNLFFEIMQQEVWNKAQSDTVGQRRLYQSQKEKYNWKQSADVILFFCSDVSAANELYANIQARPANWKKESLAFWERVFTDSVRLEWQQIPNLGSRIPTSGLLIEPLINQTDNNATFAYVLRTYPEPVSQTFEEARSTVINDLQLEMDKKWEAALRKKYPVKLDEKVFASLLK